jgi:hypothetical protein
MMTTRRSTATLARRGCVRWLVRAALVGAALALTVSGFAHPVTARAQYDHDFYTFCTTKLGQSIAYCCEHAGGSIDKDGQCN